MGDYISLCMEFDKLLGIDFYGVASEEELERLEEVEDLIRSIETNKGLPRYKGRSFYFDSY